MFDTSKHMGPQTFALMFVTGEHRVVSCAGMFWVHHFLLFMPPLL